jgi:hypothetical protein
MDAVILRQSRQWQIVMLEMSGPVVGKDSCTAVQKHVAVARAGASVESDILNGERLELLWCHATIATDHGFIYVAYLATFLRSSCHVINWLTSAPSFDLDHAWNPTIKSQRCRLYSLAYLLT